MGKLTRQQGEALPAKDFALPKLREYPIPDRGHAEQALREIHNATPTQQAEIRAAIAKRFPDLAHREPTIRTHHGRGGKAKHI